MRIAVIADIHGNDLALEAVLGDIDRRGLREIVNLGDHLSGPLNAARTADLLMARTMTTIRGNHDRALVTLPAAAMIPSDRTAHEALDENHRRWLAALPATATACDGALFLCHGTPGSDDAYWLEDVDQDGTVSPASLARVTTRAVSTDPSVARAEVLLCGHSHVPRLVGLADGRLILNPGSVGCPAYADEHPYPHVMATGTPHAAYAILEGGDGVWTASFRRIPYDHQAMAQRAQSRGRPDWAQALATGWLAR